MVARRSRSSAAGTAANRTLPLDVAWAGQLCPTQVRRAISGRADRLGDVDDAVPIEDRHVRGLTEIGGKRVARGLALLHEVESGVRRPGQPGDREPQPVVAPIGDLFDEASGLQYRDEPGDGRLVHAEFGGDLGDARLPERREDLHHEQCPIHRLHRRRTDLRPRRSSSSNPTLQRRNAEVADSSLHGGDLA